MLVTSVSFNQSLSRLPCIVSFLLMVMTFEGMLTRRSKSFLAWIVQNLALNIISRKKLDPSCHYANSNCCWIGNIADDCLLHLLQDITTIVPPLISIPTLWQQSLSKSLSVLKRQCSS